MPGTTRGELRAMVRRRLDDESPDPLWNDAFLNDAIAEAIRRYGVRLPREETTAIAVTAGAREIALPENVNDARILRLFDDRGMIWRSWDAVDDDPPAPQSPATGELAWRLWSGNILLASPAPRTGSWRIEHHASRTLVGSDDLALDMEPGDEDIHIALAMSAALSRRGIAEGKRASSTPMLVAARATQIEAERLFWLRGRRARGSAFHATGISR